MIHNSSALPQFWGELGVVANIPTLRRSVRVLMTPGAFRFLLALIVFVHHLSRFSFGNAAVFVFFILSGYWITLMWTKKYANSPTPLLTFYLSRGLRLLPVFVLINTATLLVWMYMRDHEASGEVETHVFHALFSNAAILGYASMPEKVLVPAWSLDIEVQYYLVAPLFVPLLRRWPRSALFVGAASSIGAFAIFGFDLGAGQGLVSSYLLFFLIGMAVALKRMQVPLWLGRTSLAVGAALTLLMLVWPPLQGVLIREASESSELFNYNLIVNAALALVFAPFALATTQRESGASDTMLGDMSYVLYLLHWPAVIIIGHHYGSLTAIDRLPYASFAVLLTILLTFILWRYFDRPINRWRTTLIDRRLGLPDIGRPVSTVM